MRRTSGPPSCCGGCRRVPRWLSWDIGVQPCQPGFLPAHDLPVWGLPLPLGPLALGLLLGLGGGDGEVHGYSGSLGAPCALQGRFLFLQDSRSGLSGPRPQSARPPTRMGSAKLTCVVLSSLDSFVVFTGHASHLLG